MLQPAEPPGQGQNVFLKQMTSVECRGPLSFPGGCGEARGWEGSMEGSVADFGFVFSASWFQLEMIPVRDESHGLKKHFLLKGETRISDSHSPSGRSPWVATPRWAGRDPRPTWREAGERQAPLHMPRPRPPPLIHLFRLVLWPPCSGHIQKAGGTLAQNREVFDVSSYEFVGPHHMGVLLCTPAV